MNAKRYLDLLLEGKSVTSTPEFKAWFGKSKVVDESGEPLVVYHGTAGSGFRLFDMSKGGSATDARDARGVAYFSDDPGIAGRFVAIEHFAFTYLDSLKDWYYKNKSKLSSKDNQEVRELRDMISDPVSFRSDRDEIDKRLSSLGAPIPEPEISGGVYSVYLSFKNPYIKDFKGEIWDEDKQSMAVRHAKAGGYDSVIFKHIDEEGKGHESTSYVAFEPTQIKSATGNSGKFDPDNPNINEKLSDETNKMRLMMGKAGA